MIYSGFLFNYWKFIGILYQYFMFSSGIASAQFGVLTWFNMFLFTLNRQLVCNDIITQMVKIVMQRWRSQDNFILLGSIKAIFSLNIMPLSTLYRRHKSEELYKF